MKNPKKKFDLITLTESVTGWTEPLDTDGYDTISAHVIPKALVGSSIDLSLEYSPYQYGVSDAEREWIPMASNFNFNTITSVASSVEADAQTLFLNVGSEKARVRYILNGDAAVLKIFLQSLNRNQ